MRNPAQFTGETLMHIIITRGPATGPNLYTFSARTNEGDGCYSKRHIGTVPKIGVEACKSLLAGPNGRLKAIALEAFEDGHPHSIRS